MIKKGSKLDSIEYIGNVPRAITWVVDHLETWVKSLSIANGLKKKAVLKKIRFFYFNPFKKLTQGTLVKHKKTIKEKIRKIHFSLKLGLF